jgi:apolipoprotein N-acyltransferase
MTLAPPRAGLAGWRRAALAAALGGLATLALPPLYLVPVLLLSFPGLIRLTDRTASAWGAFAVGWFFGFGHFLLGLYWISFALLVDAARFWWAMPLAAAGLPAALAVFTGLATLAFRFLPAGGIARPILFAVVWTVVEWLRGHVLTGFPWNLMGTVWVGVPAVLQAASLVGVYGLSLLTVLVAALPAALLDPAVPRRSAGGAVTAGLVLLAALGVWGQLRLNGASDAMVPGVRLRLVQAAIDQRLKWAPGERQGNVARQIQLALSPADVPVTHVIWPETAVPFFVDRDRAARMAAASPTPPGGLTITGAPRVDYGPDGTPRVYNSLFALDGAGTVVGHYDKFHLVPFGEYMPLGWLIPLTGVATEGTGFSAGPGPVTLHLDGLPPFSPLICYEAIFPGEVVDPADRPRWLLNLTNDAWYGLTAGPHQHFAIVSVRAVEEGLPLVRSANNGISGVVDAYGRVVAALGLGKRGVLDSPLPQPVETVYGRAGDQVLAALLLGCLLLAWFTRQTSGRHPHLIQPHERPGG